MCVYTYMYICVHIYVYVYSCLHGRARLLRDTWDYFNHLFFDGYCSTVQGLLDWFEVDLGFTRAYIYSNRFVCCVCFRDTWDYFNHLYHLLFLLLTHGIYIYICIYTYIWIYSYIHIWYRYIQVCFTYIHVCMHRKYDVWHIVWLQPPLPFAIGRRVICMYVHVHKYIYIYVCVCIRVYMCVYIFMYTQRSTADAWRIELLNHQ